MFYLSSLFRSARADFAVFFLLVSFLTHSLVMPDWRVCTGLSQKEVTLGSDVIPCGSEAKEVPKGKGLLSWLHGHRVQSIISFHS